jgi:polyisoprenoid-binding protein YceI
VTRFRIVPERSRVWIDASSSVHPIHSETNGLEGWFEAELGERGQILGDAASHGHLELAVGRLTSGNPLLDREMKRRIDARRYPTITGELTAMEVAAEHGHYVARGEVTFRGVTRPVDGELVVSLDNDRTVRITGQSVFDVREFDFEPPKILMLKVHPEVSVRIELIAEV